MRTALLVALLALSPLAAQEAPPEKKPPEKKAPEKKARPTLEEADKAIAKRFGEQKITLNLNETLLSEAAAFFRDLTGLGVVIGPGLDPNAQVSLQLKDVSLEQALQLMLAAADDAATARPFCGVVWLGKKDQKLPAVPPEPAEGSPLRKVLTVNFDETPFEDFTQFLNDLTGVNVVIDAKAQAKAGEAKVSLTLKDVTLAQLIAIVEAQTGIAGKLEEGTLVFRLPEGK